MSVVTLEQLFEVLDGQHFSTRQKLEEAVLEVFNARITEMPVGFSYMDAIEGALAKGWLRPEEGDHGVAVRIHEPVASVG